MKKTIVILLLIVTGLCFAFATVQSGLSESDNKTTTLSLQLDGDKYSVGFSETENDFTHDSVISFSENIDGSAMTVRLVEKEFYFFYKAITDDPNVGFKITVTPFYLDGTQVDDPSKRIDYTATINKTNVWEGQVVSSVVLDTATDSESDVYKLKQSGSNYLAKGIASVVISSTDELEAKKSGTYTGTIKVTLQSGS